MFRPASAALLMALGLAPVTFVAWYATQSIDFPSLPAPTAANVEVPAKDNAAEPIDEPVTPPTTDTPSAEKAPLSPEMQRLRDQVRQALAVYRQRPVNARDHTPWEAFHWLLAYNVEAEMYAAGPGGQKTNVVGWLCYNRPCRGQTLLELKDNRPMGIYGVGLEGHTGQFLAILGQSRVMIDYPLQVQNRRFTVADLVTNCQLNCTSGKDVELTFLLIGLSHYLHPDAMWRNKDNEVWSIPRLIHEEIGKPIKGAACGGTHRLMGLSYAVRKRQQHHLPLTTEYLRAQAYVNEYINYTLRMQNPDGSLSTEWFTGHGSRDDLDRRLQTTGHMLEWLVFSVPEERLADPQIVKSVDYVSRLLLQHQQHEWKIGHVGHGLRSISLYNRRMFNPVAAAVPEVARREAPASTPAAEQSRPSAKKQVTPRPPAGNKAKGGGPEEYYDPPPAPPL